MATEVEISWSAPYDQGSQITGYRVLIEQSDGVTYTEEIADCDMKQNPSLSCVLPVQTLKASPYSIAWGASVYAKVIAINIFGESFESAEGNGAVIITYPDAPIELQENYSQRTATSITLNWSDGLANGGSSVQDY